MTDILLYILAGAGVGLAIGMTGVGGGSLMTPLLILFGFPYNVAIGTDLLYASITKMGAAITHTRRKTVDWTIVVLLAAGSIPASLLTSLTLHTIFTNADEYKGILTTSLGIMLILTALVLLLKRFLRPNGERPESRWSQYCNANAKPITFVAGVFLGIFVTLSSVGAGALCAALLMTLYSRLPALQVVGTDIAHAVPLTLIAGLGHLLLLGNVDFKLLTCLLAGSLPAIHIGTRLATAIPHQVLQPVLATILLTLGIRFAWP
ncbi:MAG: sulfite exporter TauE/SafE family protein [Porticoccaceae bacterium]